MPSNTFRVGVAAVQLALSTSTAIGSFAAVPFTVTAVTPTKVEINDVRPALPASSTWKVVVAPVGEDKTNGGYTIGVSTAELVAAVTTTAGQGLNVHIANSDLTGIAGISGCCVMAVFLKQGAADYQLCDFAYFDPARDFDHTIVTKPLLTAPYFTAALLTAATVDDTLGDRSPKGYTFLSLAPTTGGVQVTRNVGSVTISPDNTGDFQVATTRSTDVSFQLLPNDVLDVMRAAGGSYVKFTATGGVVIEEAQQSLATAQVKLAGNKPFKLVMPIDSAGFQEVRLYLGNLTVNQTGFTENWTKTAPTPIQYTYSTAVQDKLLIDQHVEVITKFHA